MARELAVDMDGNISWCSVPPEQRGTKGCTHKGHCGPDENPQDFMNRMESENKPSEPKLSDGLPLKPSEIPELIRTSKFSRDRTQKLRLYRAFIKHDLDEDGEPKDPKSFFKDLRARGFIGKELDPEHFGTMMGRYGVTMDDIKLPTSEMDEKLDQKVRAGIAKSSD